ncbi:hypothetical protein AGMMS49938_13600 [Fibrobacterales bacterium]|nr:hypothetical protein AGMMS49938_13600 [Fibrobacterales bacterium]
MKFLLSAIVLMLLSCAPSFNLTDRNGQKFAVEKTSYEVGQGDGGKNVNLKYKVGGAMVSLSLGDIVSLEMPNAEPTIFDGRIFYPATVILEDTLSVPQNGYICVEGVFTGKNAGSKFSIRVADVAEIRRAE